MNDIENTFEYKLAKEQTIVYILESVTKDYIYKSKKMTPFYDQIKDIMGPRADFFINWLKGFAAVAEFDFETASSSYTMALPLIQDAQEYTVRFIHQAFTLFMYLEKKEEALKFWQAGADKKLLAPLDETFFANFNPKEQFWTQFVPVMFVNKSEAENKAVADYKKTYSDKIMEALESADCKKFKAAVKDLNLNSIKIAGVSPLYYAIQFKGTLCKGSQAYAEDMVMFRTAQLINSIDLSQVPESKKNETLLTIRRNMRQTYQESGLGQIMFQAYYGKDQELPSKTKEMDKIIAFIADSLSDVDSFKMNAGNGMTNTALYLAAETDDSESCRTLITKGALTDKAFGYADYSSRIKNGTIHRTSVPNTFIYRLISFGSWKALKMYLTEFSSKASDSMTKKTDKCNITPLVYLITTMIYNNRNEEEFNKNKAIVDELLPLFQKAGTKLDQNTEFGTARQLLGL